MESKTIHFYDHYPINAHVFPVFTTWNGTQFEIDCGTQTIVTTQMGLLSMDLIKKGYRIFIHQQNEDPYEIRLGSNDCTDKELRIEHNIFHMWRAGAFYPHAATIKDKE